MGTCGMKTKATRPPRLPTRAIKTTTTTTTCAVVVAVAVVAVAAVVVVMMMMTLTSKVLTPLTMPRAAMVA